MTRFLKLGKQPRKLNRDLTLLQNEKCLITVQKGTLTLPILIEGNAQGHLLTGRGQFTLDAIIDTPKGAIGKSLITDLNQPFLMFSTDNTTPEDLTPATDQDITNMGYENLEDLLVKANDVFSQFTINSQKHPKIEEDTQMFAFFTPDKTWDILIAKEDKLIFTSKNRVYIFKDEAEVTEFHPHRLMLAADGKTVIIGKNNILIDFDANQRFI
jgi:hypothetical protein